MYYSSHLSSSLEACLDNLGNSCLIFLVAVDLHMLGRYPGVGVGAAQILHMVAVWVTVNIQVNVDACHWVWGNYTRPSEIRTTYNIKMQTTA